MKITSGLFEAFLKCPTKCWLRASGEPPSGNTYAEWAKTQNESYRATETARLIGESPNGAVTASPQSDDLRTAKWQLATSVTVQAEKNSSTLEACVHAIERAPAKGKGEAAQFIPIRFAFTNKLGKDDKLRLAFDAYALSESLAYEVGAGKIIHGDDHAVLKVKTTSVQADLRKRIEKVAALFFSPTPPELVLNRHCSECEFQARCRLKAKETDDLSLLSGMSEKERSRHRSKGIFTVTQLSYTFRPRKTPKRARNPAKPHHFALQALAIRENTVYIHGTPELPQCANQVYLDIEGLPDRDFYYLIGALVVSDGQETFHSFWADSESDQTTIFTQFAETISLLPDFRVFHFGGYDAAALQRVAEDLANGAQQKLEAIRQKSTNILTLIHPQVYFPTYSNSLKELGRLLGFRWSIPDASGINAVILREAWQTSRSAAMKEQLIRYNKEDCLALKRIVDFLTGALSTGENRGEMTIKVSQTSEKSHDRPHWRHFEPKQFVSEEFGYVNKCAYFDYQREKVLVRTHRHFRTINRGHRKHKKTRLSPNKIVPIQSSKCPQCGKKRFEVRRERNWVVLDLAFTRSGVKKCVTQYRVCAYQCPRCGRRFSAMPLPPNPKRFGHGLMSWCVYWNVVCGVNMGRVQRNLGDLFEIFIPYCQIHRFKPQVAAQYQPLYAELLTSILSGPVLHVDETTVNLVGGTGYVWVLAGVDRVYYFYRPSREGEFLSDLLKPFSGVLVSDFYTAYDSLECAQQKCLVHLIREIDDDLLRNPLDEELRSVAAEFGELLKTVIETVDRYGLKKRHLHKHAKAVLRFLNGVEARELSSLVASKYQKRFQKSGHKMFTFLDHDGVPWNNNNAEHAIKRFAKHRRDADGRFTERSLKDYLVLASVMETCEFNNVNVLKFLLSQETSLDGLLRMAGRKSHHSTSLDGQGGDRPEEASAALTGLAQFVAS